MAIEAINSASMTYQGSMSAAETKSSVQNVEAPAQTQLEVKDPVREVEEEKTPAYEQAQIKKAVEDINKKASNSEAIFGIHEGTNRVTIKIVDKRTKEVIRELPPERTLDMIARVWEMAGLLVDEKR